MMQLSESELRKIAHQIETDETEGRTFHQKRMERLRAVVKTWRSRYDEQLDDSAPSMDAAANYVPAVQWNSYAKLAQVMGGLLGADAEIRAQAVGMSDQELAQTVGAFMSWRTFQSMRWQDKLTMFQHLTILTGRAFAYANWETRTFRKRMSVGDPGSDMDQIRYQGPTFEPLDPAALIVPALRGARSIQDFPWVIHQDRVTVQQLVDLARRGVYGNVFENIEKILGQEEELQTYMRLSDIVEEATQEVVGLDPHFGRSSRTALRRWRWYGRRRLPRNRASAEEYQDRDIKNRDLDETEVLVHYLPDLHLIVGVDDLRDLYPDMANRRPYVEQAFVHDFSYWAPSVPELVEWVEHEMTATARAFADGMLMSVGPTVFYTKASGFDPAKHRIGPNQMIPVADTGGVKEVQFRGDLNAPIAYLQHLQQIGEKVTGITDLTLGRGMDTPGAPRTASGQAMLIEQGNVRANLDLNTARFELGSVLNHLFDLEMQFQQDDLIFRVTENSSARVLFPNGSGAMGEAQRTAIKNLQEQGGRFDFELKFATSAISKQADKEKALEAYQIFMSNPYAQMQPFAVYSALERTLKVVAGWDLREMIPAPPKPDMPKEPMVEHALMLEGRYVSPTAVDNHPVHLFDHQMEYQISAQIPGREEYLRMLARHMLEHTVQIQQQQQLQQLATQAAGSYGFAQGMAGALAPVVAPAFEQQEQMAKKTAAKKPAGKTKGTKK